MNEKPSFFAELKRRHVDKVALAYAVVAWLLIQAASIFLPMLDAPEWVMEALVGLLVLGFILAVIISWSFEMTPEGMKRTADVTPGEVASLLEQTKVCHLCCWRCRYCVWSACLPVIAIQRRTASREASHR